jgi:hypothetical protein
LADTQRWDAAAPLIDRWGPSDRSTVFSLFRVQWAPLRRTHQFWALMRRVVSSNTGAKAAIGRTSVRANRFAILTEELESSCRKRTHQIPTRGHFWTESEDVFGERLQLD